VSYCFTGSSLADLGVSFAVRTKNVENKPVIHEKGPYYAYIIVFVTNADEMVDVRPPPKPHFAAHQPAAPKLAPAVLQPISAAGSSRLSFSYAPNVHAPRPPRVGGPRSSLVGPGARRSSIGVKPRPSRVPRLSVSGMAGFQPFALPKVGEGSGSSLAGLSEKEIDERVRDLDVL
jgi:kinesin family member 22